MLFDRNKMGLKYQPGCYPALSFIRASLSLVISFYFQIEVVAFSKLHLLTLIENSIKDSANSSISERVKLTFQMITSF